MSAHSDQTLITYLRPAKGWVPLNLSALWAYRELVYFLTWRDIKVRYKQAALGIGWAILQPVINMIIFTVIFGRLAGLEPDAGIPADMYPIFVFSALLPMQLFQGGLQRSSVSLVQNSNLLTKIYFPRLIIPFSATTAGLVDFFFGFLVLLGLMVYYKQPIGLNILWLAPLVLLTMLASLSIGLWFSALNVQYRDVQHMVPFLIQAWMYASPVAYSLDVVSGTGIWQVVYALNPMVGVIQGFRWVLLGSSPPGPYLWISVAMVVLLLVSGLYYFRHMERTFADMV